MAARVAVVTGAASGIGRATAQRLARDGTRLVLADCADPKEVAVPMNADGVEALAVTVDVADEAQVTELFERAVRRFAQVDLLVNAAGIGSPRPITIDQATVDEWDRLCNVNLKGTFLCCRAAIPLLRRSGAGAIVNVASEIGLVGAPWSAMYGATKGGVIQLTRALAVDHAVDQIRVNCVCPGPVDTPLLQRSFARAADPEAKRRADIDSTLLGRLGRPEEIAGVICFLLSDDAAFMTGSIVVVDGGVTAR